MKIFVIDNYDSFTYNLVQLLYGANVNPTVVRNDKFEISAIENYDKILISPGPSVPDDAGLTKKVIETYGKYKPILGICLGHQAIAEVYGGKISVLDRVYHGIATTIKVNSDDYLFQNIPKSFKVGRYHSWKVDADLPEELLSIATDESGIIMAIKCRNYDIRGVQFHPESILTEYGQKLINNWVSH